MRSSLKHTLSRVPAIAWLTVLAALMQAWALCRYGLWQSPDTVTYFDAWANLCTGRLDIFRTPLYPLIVGVSHSVAGSAWPLMVAVIQMAVFAASIFSFSYIASALVSNRTVRMAAMVVYAAFPQYYMYNCGMMPDSLSLSLTVIMIATAIRLVRRPSCRHIAALSAMLLILAALKPSTAAYILIIIVVAIGAFATHRRAVARNLALACIAPVIAMGLYALAIRSYIGVTTMSTVSMINSYTSNRMLGHIYPDLLPDAPQVIEFQRYINSIRGDNTLHGFSEQDVVFDYIGHEGMVRYNRYVMTRHTGDWLSIQFYKLKQSCLSANARWGLAYYCILLAFVAGTCVLWRRCRRGRAHAYLSVNVALIVYVSVIFAMNVVGAPAEWVRLNLPATPMLIVMPAMLWTQLRALQRDNRPSQLTCD